MQPPEHTPRAHFPRRRPTSKLHEFLHRNMVWFAAAVAASILIWQSLTPTYIFASEDDRIRFLKSVGAQPSTRIITLVTDWCPACKVLDRRLEQSGVAHVRLNIERDPAGKSLYHKVRQRTSSNSIPKIILDRELVTQSQLYSEISNLRR